MAELEAKLDSQARQGETFEAATQKLETGLQQLQARVEALDNAGTATRGSSRKRAAL